MHPIFAQILAPFAPKAERTIVTDYWAKPIPIREYDWAAWYDDEGEEMGNYGYGATEAAAIRDLETKYGDEQ